LYDKIVAIDYNYCILDQIAVGSERKEYIHINKKGGRCK